MSEQTALLASSSTKIQNWKSSCHLLIGSYRSDIMSETEICQDRGTAKTHDLLLAGRSTGVTLAEFRRWMLFRGCLRQEYIWYKRLIYYTVIPWCNTSYHYFIISSVVTKGDEVQTCSCCSLQGSPGVHDRLATPEGQSAVIGSWDIREWRMNYISLDMNGLYVRYVYIHLIHLCSFMQY